MPLDLTYITLPPFMFLSRRSRSYMFVFPIEEQIYQARYDCVKTKTIKVISTSYRSHSLKIHQKISEQEGPMKCLCLYSQELKP